MKYSLFLFFVLLGCLPALSAQVPQGINYQAVIRDAEGDPLTSTLMDVEVDIVNGSSLIYAEEFSGIATDEFGVLNLVIPESKWFGNLSLVLFASTVVRKLKRSYGYA